MLTLHALTSFGGGTLSANRNARSATNADDHLGLKTEPHDAITKSQVGNMLSAGEQSVGKITFVVLYYMLRSQNAVEKGKHFGKAANSSPRVLT